MEIWNVLREQNFNTPTFSATTKNIDMGYHNRSVSMDVNTLNTASVGTNSMPGSQLVCVY
jgi:hypothetical protein